MATSEPERLQRFLARSGIASRRACEDLIRGGRVSVNGEVVGTLGVRVRPGIDVVRVDGAVVEPPTAHVYLALNKPRGYVTTLRDPQGRPTVADLIPDVGRRVFPVGRLDRDTTGLLILTSDGDLANRLLHPRYHVAKTYLARVRGVPDEHDLETLRAGVILDDGPTAPADVVLECVEASSSVVRLTIQEGRKRQVRRMLGAVGHPVETLERTSFGPIALGDLEPGAVRPLAEHEVEALKRACGALGGH